MITLPIQRQLLTHPISRPALRDSKRFRLREVRAVVMHWTANTARGANAVANRNYFNLGSRHASAHYIVDDSRVVQCLPDNEVGYHVGARYYKEAGRALMRGASLNPNFYTLGIEMCVNRDGDWERTYRYSAELAAWLLLRHMPDNPMLLRHFDITGKDCPRMMLEDAAWLQFNTDVQALMLVMRTQVQSRARCTNWNLNVRSTPGMDGAIVGNLYEGEPVLILEESGNWRRIERDGWVHSRFLQPITNPPAV